MKKENNIRAFLQRHKNSVLIQLVIIHIVGVVGLNLPTTAPVFSQLSVFNLLLSAIIVALFHHHASRYALLFCVAVFLTGFLAEAIGVHTGYLFGDYYYTQRLGWKVIEVPLIIGVNWIVLTYCTGLVVNRIRLRNEVLKVFTGASMMVLLDVLLEFFAVKHQLWVWLGQDYPGWDNFIGWFVVSLITHSFYRLWMSKSQNSMAIPYLLILFVFLLTDFLW